MNLNAVPVNQEQTMGDIYDMHAMYSTRYINQELEPIDNTEALVIGGVNYEIDYQEVDYTESIIEEGAAYASVDSESYLLDRSLRGNKWTYLPYTNNECLSINKTLGDSDYSVTYLSDKEATEAAFKAIGTDRKSPRIIHLATHGFFFPDQGKKVDADEEILFKVAKDPMLRSGLLLAGANATWTGEQN